MSTSTVTTVEPTHHAASDAAVVTPTSPRRRAGGALAIAAALQAITNLLFHAVVSRDLPAAEYGGLSALLALLLLMTVPFASLQVAVALARTADTTADTRPLMARLGAGALAVGAIVVAAAPLVATFLQLDRAIDAAALAPVVVLGVWLAGARGLALGEGRTGRIAASLAIGAVVRVPAGLVLVGSYGVLGAVVATLIGELAATVVMGLPRRGPNGAGALVVGLAGFGGSFAVSAGLWCFTGVDSLLARHFLTGDESASYLAAGTVARALLALPVAVVMGNLASFAAADRAAALRRLRTVLLAVGGFAVLAALGLLVTGGLVQGALFGGSLSSNALLLALTMIAGCSGMVTATTYFLHAGRSRGALLVWVAAAVEAAVIWSWHGSPATIALGSASSLAVALLLLGMSVRRTVAQHTASAAQDAQAVQQDDMETLAELDAELDQVASAELELDATLWQPAEPTIELSVVVPFYNPGESVGRTVAQIVELLRATGCGFEVIPVSDGATDGSEAHVLAVGAPEVRLIVLPQNHGKGGALARGLSAARGRYVAFIDADGDIDPVHLVGYLHEIRTGHAMVYASKRHEESVSASSPFRKLVSFGFSSITTILFRLGVNDTQTGCKMMTRTMAADVLPFMQERRFAFDLELFVVAKRRGHRDLLPAPVELGERLAGSTVTTKAVLRTVRDMFTIWYRATVQRAYPAATPATPAQPQVQPEFAPVAAGDLARLRVAA